MLRKIRFNRNKIVVIGLLVVLLVAIRALEDLIFYDPFSLYFKNDYLSLAFPKFDTLLLFLNMSIRYGLNSLISLAIIYCLFKDWEITKFATVLYCIFFIVLIITFFVLILFTNQYNNFILFYVRRFLIQPLFLLLFVPAFYYQKKDIKK
jgi:exosortase F-associated protein